jgi:FHA domain
MTGLLLEFTMETGEVLSHVAHTATVIGRAEGAGILRVADGEFVGLPDSWLSRPHCVFAPNGDAWVVDDAGSMNGTRLVLGGMTGGMGTPLRSTTPVVSGMQLRIGHTMVRAVLT